MVTSLENPIIFPMKFPLKFTISISLKNGEIVPTFGHKSTKASSGLAQSLLSTAQQLTGIKAPHCLTDEEEFAGLCHLENAGTLEGNLADQSGGGKHRKVEKRWGKTWGNVGASMEKWKNLGDSGKIWLEKWENLGENHCNKSL